MTGEIENYQVALRRYAVAEGAARKTIKLIDDVRGACYPSNFPSFLGWQFGINDQIEQGSRFDPKINIPLDNWPSRESLQSVMQDWHDALVQVKAAWGAIPQENRLGLQAPPAKMDTRGW